jgi:hypothetical protein
MLPGVSFGASPRRLAPTLGGRHAQTRCAKPPHQVAPVDQLRSSGDESLVHVFGDVVMVQIKPSFWDAHLASERMKLIQGDV